MRININVNKDTSELLLYLIDKLNNTKVGELDKVRSKLQSMIDKLNNTLDDSNEKNQLIDYFDACINRNKTDVITVDKDPNIIDNKNLISITTNKMNKKDLIKQELAEVENILTKRSYSQLLSLYHARLFSDIEGLSGEDVEELKSKLDSISDQLEEISNSEVTSDESVEVTDEVSTEEPDEEVSEEVTEEVTEESTEESAEDGTEEEVTEEVTENPEEEESEVTTESETEEEVVEEVAVPEEVAEKIAELDAALEELKEAADTKDFSKVVARVHSRLFSEIEEHSDLIENIDEVKSAMDDLAEKLEKLDAEVDDDHSDKAEEHAEEVADAEKAEEESDDAHEEETKTESEKCMSKCGVRVIFMDGTTRHFKSEADMKEAQREEGSDFGTISQVLPDKCMSESEEDKEEVVTDEVVEVPADEVKVDAEKETVEAVAEQAAEQAVNDYMEGELFLGYPDDKDVDMAVVDEVVEHPAEKIEPTYIDEVNDEIIGTHKADDYSDEVEDEMDSADEELFLETDTYSEHESSLTKEFSIIPEYEEYNIASIDDLLAV